MERLADLLYTDYCRRLAFNQDVPKLPKAVRIHFHFSVLLLRKCRFVGKYLARGPAKNKAAVRLMTPLLDERMSMAPEDRPVRLDHIHFTHPTHVTCWFRDRMTS